ncbi:MAG: DUF6092 family protein [Chloroflexi bacterium]|nr:DUF6092 family protein [Chloroflexota bacterium]
MATPWSADSELEGVEMSANACLTEQEALEFIAYLTASADISLHEPELYGPFRLIDAASRLVGYVLENDPGNERYDFWQSMKTEIDQKKVWLMWDRPGFRQFLREMPGKVAQELSRSYGLSEAD